MHLAILASHLSCDSLEFVRWSCCQLNFWNFIVLAWGQNNLGLDSFNFLICWLAVVSMLTPTEEHLQHIYIQKKTIVLKVHSSKFSFPLAFLISWAIPSWYEHFSCWESTKLRLPERGKLPVLAWDAAFFSCLHCLPVSLDCFCEGGRLYWQSTQTDSHHYGNSASPQGILKCIIIARISWIEYLHKCSEWGERACHYGSH